MPQSSEDGRDHRGKSCRLECLKASQSLRIHRFPLSSPVMSIRTACFIQSSVIKWVLKGYASEQNRRGHGNSTFKLTGHKTVLLVTQSKRSRVLTQGDDALTVCTIRIFLFGGCTSQKSSLLHWSQHWAVIYPAPEKRKRNLVWLSVNQSSLRCSS